MILDPRDTRVLVIRAWREPSGQPPLAGAWRLSVEDVSSGRRRHFSRPDEVDEILTPILSRMGHELRAWSPSTGN